MYERVFWVDPVGDAIWNTLGARGRAKPDRQYGMLTKKRDKGVANKREISHDLDFVRRVDRGFGLREPYW